ncbi:MAG: zinc ribbon domain-containing protein [Lachnospiraceae bacterium]|nr:zinc ribbon domain-containing protein [Lachnospiraceae bacterium]
MFCANCGNQVSDDEKFCNQCGWRKPESTGAPAAPVQPEEAPASNATTGAVPAEKAGTGKKIPKGVLICIVAGILGVVGLLLMLFSSDSVKNWSKKTFSEPEEYYQWVEGRAAEEAASNAATIYNDYFRENLQIYDMSVDMEAKIELEEAGMDMLSLAGMSGVDMSWLESATVTGNVSIKDNMVSFSMGEADILSMAGILDLAEESAYMQIPDLSDMYMSADDVDGAEEMIEAFEALKVLYEIAPDEKLVEELLNKYTAMALSCVDDVEMSDGSIRAEGVTQKCVELEVTIDEKNMADMMETVLTALAEDEELKEWYVEAWTTIEDSDMDMDMAEDMDPEELYEEWQDLVEEAADEADSIADYDMEIVMVVYVDSKGNICGRTLEYEGLTVEMIMSHDGSDFGYNLSMEAGGESVALTGKGKDNGGKLTGEFAVEYNGMALVEIAVEKLDTNKLAKGQLSGTITAAPSSALVRALDMSDYSSIIGEMSVVIEAECDADSAKLVCSVLQDEEKWGTITLIASKDKGEKVKVPSDKNVVEIEDEDDFEDWYETVDWDAYIKKLEKAGVPDEIIDAIEDLEDMDAEEFLRALNYMY